MAHKTKEYVCVFFQVMTFKLELKQADSCMWHIWQCAMVCDSGTRGRGPQGPKSQTSTHMQR